MVFDVVANDLESRNQSKHDGGKQCHCGHTLLTRCQKIYTTEKINIFGAFMKIANPHAASAPGSRDDPMKKGGIVLVNRFSKYAAFATSFSANSGRNTMIIQG